MCVLGVGEKVDVWCELESVTGVMEYFRVQGNFLDGFEMWGIRRGEDVDTGIPLLAVRRFVGRGGLTEEPLTVFHCEVSHSQV